MSEPESPATDTVATPEELRVLVVMYEEMNRRGLKRVLLGDKDVKSVVTVGSLDEARREIATGAHNVVLTDWNTVNGREVSIAAKAQPGIEQIVVLGGGYPLDVEDQVAALGVNFARKPYGAAEIRGVIRGKIKKV